MKFDFATSNRIIFGSGSLERIPELTRQWGTTALLVSGTSTQYKSQARELLTSSGIECHVFSVSSEPTIEVVTRGVDFARQTNATVVVCVGGGSALDCGKAISALVCNPGNVLDYLEVVGSGKPLTQVGLPLIAAPTTAGTGSEVTRNAVIGVPEKHVKVSLRSNFLLPRAAVVDPALTLSLPKPVTASTGMDALTQLIEPFVCKKANWFVDALCLDGIRRVARALPRAYDEPANLQAREEMSYSSLLSGMALANAGLGAAHGFAGPIGGMFFAPHGAVCARLLPGVVRMNVRVLKTREPNAEILHKYDEIARILTGKKSSTCEDGIRWLEDLCAALQIPNLRGYGVNLSHLESIAKNAENASSMKANPVTLTREELIAILEEAL